MDAFDPRWSAAALGASVLLNAWLVVASVGFRCRLIRFATTWDETTAAEEASNARCDKRPLDPGRPGLGRRATKENAHGSAVSTAQHDGNEDTFLTKDGRSVPSRSSGSSAGASQERVDISSTLQPRPVEECLAVCAEGKGTGRLTDEEIIVLVQQGKVPIQALEVTLGDSMRAVRIRRSIISRESITKTLETCALPYKNYDYSPLLSKCENVIGWVPIPVGIAGPLRIDGVTYHIPLATTEGALVASVSRGCKAINAGGGVRSVVVKDAMMKEAVAEFETVEDAAEAKRWVESEEGWTVLSGAFDGTSGFAELTELRATLAGRTIFARIAGRTGRGLDIVDDAIERAFEKMGAHLHSIARSSKPSVHKGPSALDELTQGGKSVVAGAVVPGAVVQTVLGTSVEELCKLNVTKNLVGSALAGCVGGSNAQASNVVTAIFLATGQNPGRNSQSSKCMSLIEPVHRGEDLLITCTMPSIDVSTVGGGTSLPPQAAMLDLLGLAGTQPSSHDEDARQLARIVCGAVMAGELSLLAALADGDAFMRSHMAHNRSGSPSRPLRKS